MKETLFWRIGAVIDFNFKLEFKDTLERYRRLLPILAGRRFSVQWNCIYIVTVKQYLLIRILQKKTMKLWMKLKKRRSPSIPKTKYQMAEDLEEQVEFDRKFERSKYCTIIYLFNKIHSLRMLNKIRRARGSLIDKKNQTKVKKKINYFTSFSFSFP